MNSLNTLRLTLLAVFFRIRNIIRWLPVIWKDRDDDEHYIFLILRQKLLHVEKYLRVANFVGNQREADKVHFAVMLLDRIIAQNYHEIAYRQHRMKWGEPQPDFVHKDGMIYLAVTYPNALTEQEQKQAQTEASRCAELERFLEKQDIETLFRHLSKHVQGWWE